MTSVPSKQQKQQQQQQHQYRGADSVRYLIWQKVAQPQFYWFLGHFLTLYHYLRHNLSFSQVSSRYHYGSVLFYVFVTYGIVLYQFYKSGQLKPSTIKMRMRSLDNLQYFMMTLILWFCKSAKIISLAIVSPVIFSLFHSLNYFKENLLPLIPMNAGVKSMLSNSINFFITNYNEKCLMLAQTSELATLIQVILMLPIDLSSLLFGVSVSKILGLLAILAYFWFFKLRYLQSPQMKAIVQSYNARSDQLFQDKAPQVFTKWLSIKNLVIRMFELIPT